MAALKDFFSAIDVIASYAKSTKQARELCVHIRDVLGVPPGKCEFQRGLRIRKDMVRLVFTYRELAFCVDVQTF
jgi:hypothetical protein